VPNPNTTNSRWRYDDSLFTKFIGNPDLAKSRIIGCHFDHCLFNIWGNPVHHNRFSSADFLEGQFSSGIVHVFKSVEGITAVTHYFTRMGNIAKFFS
jgi:hypothetical protein